MATPLWIRHLSTDYSLLPSLPIAHSCQIRLCWPMSGKAPRSQEVSAACCSLRGSALTKNNNLSTSGKIDSKFRLALAAFIAQTCHHLQVVIHGANLSVLTVHSLTVLMLTFDSVWSCFQAEVPEFRAICFGVLQQVRPQSSRRQQMTLFLAAATTQPQHSRQFVMRQADR